MKLLKLLITISAISLVLVNTALALPEMLDSFNAKYNTKGTVLDTCDLCHVPQSQRSSCDEECHAPNYQPQKFDPVNLNPYGLSFKDHLNIPADRALTVIENISSAGDKIPNINKIRNLSFPGNRFGQKNNTNPTNPGNKDLLSELADMLNNLMANHKIQPRNLPP